MKKIRCFLVDDEPPALLLLEKYASMVEQIDVVGTSSSAVKAFDMLKKIDVDLMFLDIRMPVLNGIDFLRTLKHPPAVILTTAYREYALEGYDLDIIDYLLKPIPFDRFLKSIERYRDRVLPASIKTSVIDNEIDEHIYLNVNRTKQKVLLKNILYVESLKDYVRIHMKDDKIVVKGNLGSTMKLLSSDRFIRIHRSYAVAKQFITSYNLSEVEVNGHKLPIGISYKEEFKNHFKT